MMPRRSLRFPNGIPRAAMSDNPAQPDIDAVPVALNGDLRDRIAAVWLKHDGPYSQYKPDTDLMRLACDCGWVGETDEYIEYANHFADTVIEALGLRQEWAVADADGDHVYVGHLEENADKYTVQPGDHKEIRYVTEWMSLTDDTTGDVNHA